MRSHFDEAGQKRPFCVVPVRAVADKRLTETDRLVLMALGYYSNRAGVCWPSVASLSEMSGVSPQTVQVAVKRLIKHKIIRQLNPNDYDQKAGQWGHSNRYQVMWAEDAPVPTYEEVLDANLMQPHADRLPVIIEGSGVRGMVADYDIEARVIAAAFAQAIEETTGSRPVIGQAQLAIAARLADAGVGPLQARATTMRIQRAMTAARRGIAAMIDVELACTNDIRSDGVCTEASTGLQDRPVAQDPR
jgi:DNA-binding Lrp family transcriptional regulator